MVVVDTNPGVSGEVRVDLGVPHRDEQEQSVASVSPAGTSGSTLRRPC